MGARPARLAAPVGPLAVRRQLLLLGHRAPIVSIILPLTLSPTPPPRQGGEPGRLRENAYFESFNSKLRDELLNGETFYSLAEARLTTDGWRRHYNAVRAFRERTESLSGIPMGTGV